MQTFLSHLRFFGVLALGFLFFIFAIYLFSKKMFILGIISSSAILVIGAWAEVIAERLKARLWAEEHVRVEQEQKAKINQPKPPNSKSATVRHLYDTNKPTKL